MKADLRRPRRCWSSLAIVGSIAKKQLQAPRGRRAQHAAPPAIRRLARATGTGAAIATAADRARRCRSRPRSMQEQARDDTARALEQGAERNQRADP